MGSSPNADDPGRSRSQGRSLEKMQAILIALLSLILSSCGEDYEKKEEQLVNLVAKNRMGDSDYWLELRGDWTGEWYKVGLIFGFGGGGGTIPYAKKSLTSRIHGLAAGRPSIDV